MPLSLSLSFFLHRYHSVRISLSLLCSLFLYTCVFPHTMHMHVCIYSHTHTHTHTHTQTHIHTYTHTHIHTHTYTGGSNNSKTARNKPNRLYSWGLNGWFSITSSIVTLFCAVTVTNPYIHLVQHNSSRFIQLVWKIKNKTRIQQVGIHCRFHCQVLSFCIAQLTQLWERISLLTPEYDNSDYTLDINVQFDQFVLQFSLLTPEYENSQYTLGQKLSVVSLFCAIK